MQPSIISLICKSNKRRLSSLAANDGGKWKRDKTRRKRELRKKKMID